MRATRGTSFAGFWQEVRTPYIKLCISIAWRLPLFVLLGLPIVAISKCYGWLDQPDPHACAILQNPSIALARLTDVVALQLYLWFLLVGYALILYLEWDKYRKDEPSYLTHSKGCEGPPGYTRRLKVVSDDSLTMDSMVLHADVLSSNHRRYRGAFSEATLIRYIRQRFARTENKPTTDSADHVHWHIRQNNGNEVRIDLTRQEGISTWTLRTEFYQWSGRKSPPTLAETHITEFVPQA